MDIIKALQYFNSEDGPHISVNKLSIYCGVNENTLRDYIKERCKPSPKMRAQLEQGLSDMMKEMHTEWHI